MATGTIPPIFVPSLLVVDADPYAPASMGTCLANDLSLAEETVYTCGDLTSALETFDRYQRTIRAVVTEMRVPYTIDSPAHVWEPLANGGCRVYDHVRMTAPDVPIVFVSGAWWAEAARLPDARSHFFQKPVSPKAIADWIQSIWRRNGWITLAAPQEVS